ncbi:hypothetical protein [Methanocalculus sp.]|uniref:hypothetical protein n=1 Tax=Methanocalculus sp. TaxID=2004547 RepID=UPI00271CA49F|nr:hypothetical protein [Methanocalculus sp.]MDO8841776.1 hypothetical protein [Methanocalculus sp.]
MKQPSEERISPYESYSDEAAMYVEKNRKQVASDLAGYAHERKDAANAWRREVRQFREAIRDDIQRQRQESREFINTCSRERIAEKEKYKHFQRSVQDDINRYRSERAEGKKQFEIEIREHHAALRSNRIAESADLQKMIRALRDERIQKAKVLHESLSAFNNSLKESVHAFLLRTASDRKASMDELNLKLIGFQQQRRELRLAILADIRQLHKDLASEHRSLAHKTRELLDTFHEERRKNSIECQDYLHSFTYSLRRRQQISRPDISTIEVMECESQQEPPPIQQEESQAIDAHDEDDIESLKERILEVVSGSPSGITLTVIGSQMEIEWRKLIRPARDLLNEGLIRKEDVEYFPKKEEEPEQEPYLQEPPGE